MRPNGQVKKDLLSYLLMQVKQKELDIDRAKEFIKAIAGPEQKKDDPIAVVGIACRFPGASDKERFWSNLVDGRESIGDFPPLRLDDLRRVGGGSTGIRKGGYLDRIDLFDPAYFGIPPQVALQLDPYHRNLMEVLVETMEDAGYSKSELYGSNIGIFVGNDHTHRLITSYLPFLSGTDFSAITGSWSGILASRLSYLLNLRGPATVIDTGCSSALVALDLAMKSIRQGDCDTAFVAAINLFLAPSSLGNETESHDCRVRAFDAAANGTVWSEGVAGMYIKPLPRAIADKDHIYGLILGSAVNNDGRSNGLTAPNAQAQKNLLLSAWQRAGIPPESLSYIEGHGTGTTLGDPIEIKGLTSAFAAFTSKRQFCALGSVKTNIGHTVGVAGLASLIKTLLCLERRAIPPSIHFDVPNRFLDLAESPVYVCDRLTEWEEAESPRRAGVSSFSLSGTNCHIVLEEAPAQAARPDSGQRAYLYPISARNEELLARTAALQLAFLDRHPEYRVDDVCFTMQVGREHQPARAVILSDGREGLRDGLRQLSQGPEGNEGALVLHASVETPAEEDRAADTGASAAGDAGTGPKFDLPDRYRHLGKAVADFLEGGQRPFAVLDKEANVCRVPLPPQLFDHIRLWDENVRPDRAMLPAAESVSDAPGRIRAILSQPSRLEGEAEATASRKVIAWVWSDVLGYPTIRGTDDFFAMGGDSVSSLKITQLLNAGFGLEIQPGTLLAKPVFDDFADALIHDFGLSDECVRSRLSGPDRSPTEAAEGTEEYELPLTASQRSMFLSSRLDENSVAYNVSGLTIRQSKLDLAEIEASLRTLVRRHDSLRSTFHMIQGQPIQRVHVDVPVTIEHRRLGGLAAGESHESRARQQMKEFVRPFRLDAAPLFRVACFEFDDGVTCVAVDMHHIITDGTSMGILFRDFAAMAKGTALPPLPRSYRSAIQELLERQNEVNLLAHRNYWVRRFADRAPELQLNTDWHRADVATGTGATYFATFDGPTLDAAKRYGREHNLTLSMVFLGVFHQLLSRMSGQNDVVIGTPVMGRPDLTYQDLVGMFVNTLPLRYTAGPATGVGEFFTGLKSTVLEAFEHQIYPLPSLIEQLDPPREPGRRPLFDVCFVHQNTDMGLQPEDEQVIPFDDGSAKYDLTLSTRECDGGLLMEWEYSTALFREETVRLYAERYVKLLESVLAADDHDELGTLELIPTRELALIQRFATTPAPPIEAQGVVRLFEQQVAIDPDRTALIMDDERLSYGELNARANRVAHGLIQQGVAAGTPIALLMDRSFDMITAIIGILKARCHYVPLNTEFPAERLRMIVDDSGADLLLSAGAQMEPATALACDRLRIVDLRECIRATEEIADPGLASSSDDAIYIMYTSGTTGVPKGSLIRQKSVLRVVRQSTYYTGDPSDVFLMLSDYSFDGSVYDMYGALTNGAALVIMDKMSALDLDRLGAVIERHQVTSFFITTAMFNMLIDNAAGSLGSVRRMIFGGEVASPVHVKKAFDLLGAGRVAHAYGPTETTVFATVVTLDSFDEKDAIPIGRPINDTSLWVLDEQLRPQPIGASGELYIGGAGLSDGYLNRPDLTAERFVHCPAVPERRLYKTGDIVTFKSNGLLYYTGRIDQQVKLRGYRIELAEIIHVAMGERYVRWAHAAVYETKEGSKSLCLWVRYENGEAHKEPRLRAALERRLPSYMVPSFIVETDVVPLNKNGKVDAAALKKPDFSPDMSAERPVTELQQRLAASWSDVLGVPVADIDANFFALGGDSIKAIQIVAKLKEHDLAIQVMDLLEHQTIRLLEEKVAEAGLTADSYDQKPISGPVTAGPIQRAFLSDAGNQTLMFNQSLLITLEERAPKDRLMRAMQRLVRHHDLLRIEVDEQGRLSIREVGAPSLVHGEEAPDGLSDKDRTEYLKALQARVDVRGGPVVAFATGLGPQHNQLAVAIHHLAVDVVSWGILLEDLFTCLTDPDAGLPGKTMAFPAWTAELTRHAEQGGFRSQLPYWTELARRAGETGDLYENGRLTQGESVAETIRIDETDDVSLLDAARAAYGTSSAQTLVGILARAIAISTGHDGILFTLEGHGREPFAGNQDLSRTVGWFTSTFPHLVQVKDSFQDTFDSVRRSFDRLPGKGFGFGALLWLDPALGEERSVLEAVRPQISFNYLGDQSGRDEVTHLPSDITIGEQYHSPHVLDIIAYRTKRAVFVEVRYPKEWRERGGDRALVAAIKATFHEVRDAVKAGGRRGLRTSPSIRQDVLEEILASVAGGK